MRLDRLFRRGSEFLGCSKPIMCGAMTWVSDGQLVAAMGRAGGFGLLAGGNAPVETLRQEIVTTRELSDRPFGVNLITIAPNFKDHLAMVSEMECHTIVFAGSFPKASEISKAKDSGAKVICFAPTQQLALRLIDQGADALILEGSEAGGHIGPVSLSVLLQQILFKIDHVPIFVAGGIATGAWMAHLLLMGASGVQMGTRFVLSTECSAHQKFKEVFQKARARDAMATPQFDSRLPVIPVRALRNPSSTEFSQLQLRLLTQLDSGEMSREEAQYEVERFWMGALRRAVIDGDVESGSLMAGQSVGLVQEIKPLADIIDELCREAEDTLRSIHQRWFGS